MPNARVALAVMPVAKKRLEAWQRVGTHLEVKLFARVPTLERALVSIDDAAWEALPYEVALKPLVPPSAFAIIAPEGRYFFSIDDEGGKLDGDSKAVARIIAEAVKGWLPMISDLRALALHLVANYRDRGLPGSVAALESPAPVQPLPSAPDADLVAAAAFWVAGDAERAKAMGAQWRARSWNADINAQTNFEGTINGAGVTPLQRRLFAEQVGRLIGVDLLAPRA